MDEWFNEGKKQKTKLCHKVFSALKNQRKKQNKNVWMPFRENASV